MKTFLTKSKSSLLLLVALSAQGALAKPVAQVVDVVGQVFVISPAGKTVSIKVNDHIEEKSEVMVEEGGTISLNDYYDATYHLIGGSHMKVFNKSVQLKKGKVWVEAKNPGHALALITANGQVDFKKSEFVVTFDSTHSRSQFLIVNGDVDVSNVLNKDAKQTVSAGNFTLIDPEVENGSPRAPTKVGLQSLNAALSDFKKLPKNMASVSTPAAARSIASTQTAPLDVTKKGEITFITSTREPASVKGDAYSYFKKSTASTAKRSVSSKDVVPVRFFGISPVNSAVVPHARLPASIKPSNDILAPVAPSRVDIDPEFENSLKKQSLEQPKHTKELESLIQDLKSY